jgi:hypothetical protein
MQPAPDHGTQGVRRWRIRRGSRRVRGAGTVTGTVSGAAGDGERQRHHGTAPPRPGRAPGLAPRSSPRRAAASTTAHQTVVVFFRPHHRARQGRSELFSTCLTRRRIRPPRHASWAGWPAGTLTALVHHQHTHGSRSPETPCQQRSPRPAAGVPYGSYPRRPRAQHPPPARSVTC